jgi:alkanesulfonate monooxygenase SsuD/methylene tetrahydromethanopterin reductase-like flavin-dependent oxidoreductase (luciferase family)
MLQHYSPYKVAENFNVLAAIAPGRVDLGVGKAPGGLPLSTRALQQGQNPQQKGSFADQLTQLDGWLRNENPSQDDAVRHAAATGSGSGIPAGSEHRKRAVGGKTRLAFCLCRTPER